MAAALKKRWRVASTTTVGTSILPQSADYSLADYPDVLRQLLYNRGITDPLSAQEYLTKTGSCHDPFLLSGMQTAAARIAEAIDQRQPIAVYGDFDVDGVTATALLVQAIRRFGGEVQGYIPNRFEEGYGLNMDAVEQLAGNGVRLLVTVDCGIRSPKEVEHTRSLGMDVIISDHHEPTDVLPAALAIICQKQLLDEYPEKNLAGVGLAFKMVEALVSQRPEAGVDPAEWLDLVALGTVSDIVPLVGENRALVRAGLSLLRQGKRPGLRALSLAAGIQPEILTARDIGFVLGPRLNAAGRLDTAQAAFGLLMAEDMTQAGILAQELDNQNTQRQKLTQDMVELAECQSISADTNLIFSINPAFKIGIVGLVASRLVDAHYRPAIVGAQGEEFTRASCRSIPEFHITRALDECADLMERHGGHAMAAGFTIRNDRAQELNRRLVEIANQALDSQSLSPVLHTDMEITFKELHPNILTHLEMLEPTGLENPPAAFVSRNLRVLHYKKIGKDQRHLRLTLSDGNLTYDAVAFRQGDWADRMPDRLDILYAYEVNQYKGKSNLQLNIRDMKPAGEPDA